MARRTQGPLHRLMVRLDLGPDLGPAFEQLAAHNARTLSAEALVAIRAWVQHHAAAATTSTEEAA